MIITHIKADGFRNLKEIDFCPENGTNIIYGENAQGKTNLMEAVWIATGEKSFRGARDRDLIAFDSDKAEVEVSFRDNSREQVIAITLSKNPPKKRVLLNGVKLRSASELLGKLLCVVFTPEDLELTKGSPERRRDYLDRCISQIKPLYLGVVTRYEKVLAQRNAVLKNIYLGISRRDELDIWDEQLAKPCAYISMMRCAYTDVLNSSASRLYESISHSRERLQLEYLSTVYGNLRGRNDYKTAMAEEYKELLRSLRKEDIRSGFTTAGIHRDDMGVFLNDMPVKDFGSQGQNRSAALCMKLGQARVLHTETGERPVVLLDDVLSELDRYRREFVISEFNQSQTVITSCEGERIKGCAREMREGRLGS